MFFKLYPCFTCYHFNLGLYIWSILPEWSVLGSFTYLKGISANLSNKEQWNMVYTNFCLAMYPIDSSSLTYQRLKNQCTVLHPWKMHLRAQQLLQKPPWDGPRFNITESNCCYSSRRHVQEHPFIKVPHCMLPFFSMLNSSSTCGLFLLIFPIYPRQTFDTSLQIERD